MPIFFVDKRAGGNSQKADFRHVYKKTVRFMHIENIVLLVGILMLTYGLAELLVSLVFKGSLHRLSATLSLAGILITGISVGEIRARTRVHNLSESNEHQIVRKLLSGEEVAIGVRSTLPMVYSMKASDTGFSQNLVQKLADPARYTIRFRTNDTAIATNK